MYIYCITNRINGKIYIGQHSGNDLERYLKLKSHGRSSRLIYRAIQKYGIENFAITSLVRPCDKQQMDELERFFIRSLGSQDKEVGYNINAGGEGNLGLRHSEQSRRKMSQAGKGRVKSLAQREKISKAHRGMKKPWVTVAQTGRPNPSAIESNKKRTGKQVAWNKGKIGVQADCQEKQVKSYQATCRRKRDQMALVEVLITYARNSL